MIIILDPVQKKTANQTWLYNSNANVRTIAWKDVRPRERNERTWKKAAAERNKIKFACLGKSSSAETQNPICLACDGLSQLPRWVHGSNWIKLMAISSKVCRHIVYSLGTLLSLAHLCTTGCRLSETFNLWDAAFSFRRIVRPLIKCSWSVL